MFRPNGFTLTVPPENTHVSNLSIGDIVTFSYETHGQKHLPMNVVIYKRRNDVSWKDVVQLFVKDQIVAKGMVIVLRSMRPYICINLISTEPLVVQYPTLSIDQMRSFMENFAHKIDMDPLSPNTWYKVNESDICQFKVLTSRFSDGIKFICRKEN